MATFQMHGQWASENDKLKMGSNFRRAKGPSDLRNEGGMLSGPAVPLPFNFLMAESSSPIWSGAQLGQRWCIETFLELSVEVTIDSWHVEFADPGIVVYKDVGFGFDISDGSTVVQHCFVWRVGIRSTVQTLDDFPHIWAVWIRHYVLKEIFPTFYFGLIDSLGGFMASIHQLLSILMYCPTEVISSMDFGSHMWNHPRFRFLTRFSFSDVCCCSWDENVIEMRYTNR